MESSMTITLNSPEVFNNEWNSPLIETYSGRRINLRDPKEEDIDIEDIAHSLANQCRFGGHCRHFMSVAEHSIYVAAGSLNRLEGLLHDATEAYVIDLPSPIKVLLPDYKVIENRVGTIIAKKFNISWPISSDTKEADTAQLIAEARWLLSKADWTNDYKTSKVGITPNGVLGPAKAKQMFLNVFHNLTGG